MTKIVFGLFAFITRLKSGVFSLTSHKQYRISVSKVKGTYHKKTGGRVKQVEDTEEHGFRKEKYLVHVRYWICEDTGEQFTVESQDDFVVNQIYSLYRHTHGIPFDDEIKALRNRYGLNYTQMDEMLRKSNKLA